MGKAVGASPMARTKAGLALACHRKFEYATSTRCYTKLMMQFWGESPWQK